MFSKYAGGISELRVEQIIGKSSKPPVAAKNICISCKLTNEKEPARNLLDTFKVKKNLVQAGNYFRLNFVPEVRNGIAFSKRGKNKTAFLTFSDILSLIKVCFLYLLP